MLTGSETTTTALLEGLLDPANEPVWREFDARYRPIIIGFARQLGLREVDAADAAQETLLKFVQEYRAGRYDRSRGRLRSWIIGIARCRVADLKRMQDRRRERRGESAFADHPGDDRLSEIWDAECRRVILHRAIGELREKTKMDARTIRAFELLACEQRQPADVASELAMSVSDVYVAKHRALDRLRTIVAELHRVYETDLPE